MFIMELLCVQLVATELPEEHRLAPAVNFKNFVKANWVRGVLPETDWVHLNVSNAVCIRAI
jgi:hypothetical protein